MKIHEHQGKELFRRYGIPVPNGKAAFSVEEARAAGESLNAPLVVVKAQIHAGGRGKGGGVKLARSAPEVVTCAQHLLGMTLITPQTGPAGKVVRRLLVEEGCEIRREFYAGLVLDRSSRKVVTMVSTEGGMEIEEVAAAHPEKIMKEYASAGAGLQPYQARKLAFGLGLSGKPVDQAVALFQNLFRLFVELDCSLVEINPLALTADDRLLALDAKINLDDNALYRHPKLADMRDPFEEDPMETEAVKHGLSYIKLDGAIGCLVNGAGLAMATMDMIQHFGGAPANFLDVGGGANAQQVAQAFKIILSDPAVKAILVNIFGGIMRCDIIAEGIIQATREVHPAVPLVVRLDGTNVEEGRRLLAGSRLAIVSAENLEEATRKTVRLAQGGAA